ncbi:MAG TPA: C13 family peptidase [Steroidobacteraceae bacterium]|nr:C13 family peptidase [Steroidobacteraceae bacterium]
MEPSYGAGLLRNLRGGLALLGLRRLRPERFARSFDQLATLLLINLLVWAALDTLHAEEGSRLMLDGLYGWAFYLLIGLFACGIVARAYCRQADTRSLLIPVLAVAPCVLILFWLLSDTAWVATHPVTTLLLAVIYLLVLAVRVIQAAYSQTRPKAVVLAAVFVVAAPWVLQALNLDTRLWLTDDVDSGQSADEQDAESVLYDQPARIVASVDHLAPRKAGASNVFYVGFAGDGGQEVFKREALFAEDVFAQHFGSGDRSVQLINADDDRDSYPIATVTGLSQTLKLVASRMNPEEDVLVLLLSSHGSEDGLAVENGNLPLLQLGPAELQHALDDSGIKWRVVIVSACYAGVFMDALTSDDTLVMTASDASHSSFGCDDDRDLTYFGEALLKDSLPGSASLEQAFNKAAQLIRDREAREHKTPSNPQMSIGAGMRRKLLEIEGAGHPPGQGTIVINQRGHAGPGQDAWPGNTATQTVIETALPHRSPS